MVTPDADFIDIDWLRSASRRVAVIFHGLEGSTQAAYMKGMAKALFENGYQVAAVNLRGCSGEMNLKLKAYHSGATDDVATVINHVFSNIEYDEMVLVGFSLGGNLLLKYLGENLSLVSWKIKRAVAISAPCDLAAASANLDKPINIFYRNRFLKTLMQKALQRIRTHGFSLSEKELLRVRTLKTYDDCFTAPLFGFKDAADYYEKSSSRQFLHAIKIPVLILTAQDDPFFTPASLPFQECRIHKNVFLETPLHGGHVGFILDYSFKNYFSEQKTLEFLNGDNIVYR